MLDKGLIKFIILLGIGLNILSFYKIYLLKKSKPKSLITLALIFFLGCLFILLKLFFTGVL